PPLPLPGTFEEAPEAHAYVAAVDPEGDRLVQTSRLGLRYLPLRALALEGEPPVEPRPHERRIVARPPTHWYREALALRQRDEEAPPIDLPVGEGGLRGATLRTGPHLPLGDAGSLVLFHREDPYEFDPWTLSFTNAFEARIVDEAYPAMAGSML